MEKIAPPGSRRAALVERFAERNSRGLERLRAGIKLGGSRESNGEYDEYEGYAESDYDEAPEEEAPAPAPSAPVPVPVPAPAAVAAPVAQAVQMLNPSNVNASSVAPSSKNANDAANAIDRNPRTWWGEGASGDGIGEWFEYSWSGSAEVREIRLIGGYQKEVQDTVGDRWPLNNRLRRVTVIIPGATSFDAGLEDRKGFQTIAVPPGNFGTSVRIVIMDVYRGYNAAGKHIEDSGISEIEVFGIR